jgi:hypothetical protein
LPRKGTAGFSAAFDLPGIAGLSLRRHAVTAA